MNLLPAPVYCIQRVLEDCKYTQDHTHPIWDIPSWRPLERAASVGGKEKATVEGQQEILPEEEKDTDDTASFTCVS